MKDDIKNTKEKLVGEMALVKGMYCSYRGSESSSQQSCSLAHKPVTPEDLMPFSSLRRRMYSCVPFTDTHSCTYKL